MNMQNYADKQNCIENFSTISSNNNNNHNNKNSNNNSNINNINNIKTLYNYQNDELAWLRDNKNEKI